jgi:saccharopine dehydrogenase-like NADP-dependent oxidoreductase
MPLTTVAVLGGGGAMGRIVVRDLVETAGPDTAILIADRDGGAARALAQRLGRGRRVRAVEVDALRPAPAARALAGSFAIINCGPHSANLAVMDVALRVGAHYLDLGGLFHVTRAQMKLDARFRRAGLLALIGIGAAPGIVNVLARSAADEMDRVDEIHVLVANVDRTRGREPGVLATSYSLDTIIDEASLPAAVFTQGALAFVEPMSDPWLVRFPAPVGVCHPARTLHSEVATLPVSYRDKGIREVSFRIAFPDALGARLRFLHALGLTSADPIRADGVAVAPREVLMALHRRLPPPAPGGPPDEHEVLRVVVRGVRGGRRVEDVVDCQTAGIAAWGLGVDVDTGCPPSIAVQLVRDGLITARGVQPPERAVPAAPFFVQLRQRGMTIRHRRRQMSGARNGRDAVSPYPPSPRRASQARASTH